MQASLFEKPLRPLPPPEFVFGYKYTSARRPHTTTHHDWEVQAAHLVYLKLAAHFPSTSRASGSYSIGQFTLPQVW